MFIASLEVMLEPRFPGRKFIFNSHDIVSESEGAIFLRQILELVEV